MADLERILQLTPGTLSQQWYEDGAAVDPGTVTIGITSADGTVIVTAGTGTTGAGSNPRTYSLTTTHTALLDRFTVTWTSTSKGTLVSYVEVVGDFVFTLAELSALKPGNLTWSASTMAEMRTTVEQSVEDEYGTALVPRYRYETLSGHPNEALKLRAPVRAIRSASVNGVALDQSALDGLYVTGGYVTGYQWAYGIGNVVVGYEYGLDDPPRRMRQAALRLARQWLVSGPVDDRALGAVSPDGNFSFGLATPGRGGSIFGLPDLDAAIHASPYRVGV